MNYEKKLALAKEALDSGSYDKETIEYIFPELKESEDEKLRKAIVATIHLYYGESLEDEAKEMIAWIEKQEQKPTDEEMKEALQTEYEKGRADAIAEIQNPVDCIDCTNSKGCINCEDGNMKETLVQKTAWSKEDEETLGWLCTFLNIYGHEFYEGNEENVIDWLKSFKSRIQLQQEWSEEDETTINNLVWAISNDCIRPQDREDYCDWLKSLKDRYSWEPSDKQMKALHDLNLIGNISYAGQGQVLIELYNDLKKLAEE